MTDQPTWHKSSYSGSGNCVELRTTTNTVVVRNSNTGSTIAFTRAEWQAFLAGVKNGEFDQETR